MNKFKNLVIVSFCLANLTLACTREQKKEEKAIKQHTLAPQTTAAIPQTDSLDSPKHSPDQLIALFRQHPCFSALDSVENAIQIQLPELPLEQRYKLLAQWQKVLTPHIHHLDPEQAKLLPVFDRLEVSWIDGETSNNRRKRVETQFQKGLSPKKKLLFQQLLNHHIEIRHEEENGAVFHLSPSYWKSLFASNLEKDGRKFWDQRALENDPIIDYDAGLVIDRVTLGDWAFYWEQFLKQYPKSHYKKEAQQNYQNYLSQLLAGLENTPTTEDDSNKLLPEVAQDFDEISKRHPGSDVALSIAAFRKKLATSDDKIALPELSRSSIVPVAK